MASDSVKYQDFTEIIEKFQQLKEPEEIREFFKLYPELIQGVIENMKCGMIFACDALLSSTDTAKNKDMLVPLSFLNEIISSFKKDVVEDFNVEDVGKFWENKANEKP